MKYAHRRLTFLLAGLPLLLTGCFSFTALDKKLIDKNQELSDTVKNKYQQDLERAKEDLEDKAKDAAYNAAEKTFKFIATSLTDAAKRQIDQWLQDHNLNQYGDPEDTIYAGGSPLYDEATGEQKDKYEYILEKNPNLVDELDLNK